MNSKAALLPKNLVKIANLSFLYNHDNKTLLQHSAHHYSHLTDRKRATL